LRLPADANAHPTSYAFACYALHPRKKRKKKNFFKKIDLYAHFIMMWCPPFHPKFLHSDFKSSNDSYIICGLL